MAVLTGRPASAQTPRDFAVDLRATVSSNTPCITLAWSLRQQSKISSQKVYRRLKGDSAWTPLADLATNDTGYADSTAVPGVEYEYWMRRTFSGLSPSPAAGYISSGVDVPFAEARGTLLLVVDDTMATPLAIEIAQLTDDLAADGWTVQTLVAQRTDTAANVKAQIQAAYNAAPSDIKMVYLLGHVPVPYSGNIAPDGHTDHVGAWPADNYYGDMDGIWTDTTVNNTSASRTQNDNVPGDGKFDQSSLPSALELMVGRVDMRGMTRAPSTASTETMLMRRYLRKAHDYRHKQGAYADIPRRGVLRDGFGYFSGEAFAINGWSWMFSSVGLTVDEPPSGQWFSPSYAGGKDYLVGYGNGGGSYDSASSVGNTLDFGLLPSRAVFTSLFGSYFGDWDSDNNFLRAPLAGNATGDSLGLTCFWGGRPNHFLHTLGMGETVGYAERLTQNANFWSTNFYPLGSSTRGVHCGLMGDPALRLHAVAPPRNLTIASASTQISLAWSAPAESDIHGYHVYRSTSRSGPYSRLTDEAVKGTAFTDADVTAGQSYVYLVKTLKRETAPGGTYFNLSVGSLAEITARSATTAVPAAPAALSVTATAATNAVLAWTDCSTNETGFRIERKINGTGSFATLASVAAGVQTYRDAGPFSHANVYCYRVVALGSSGDSPPSQEASFEALAGHFDLPSTRVKVNKSAGSVTLSVNRFGGATGAVSVNYATSDSSAIAGTHYTAASGTLTWADGETGVKTFTVPVINTATPQPGCQFKVTLSGNSAGTGITLNNKIAVLIEDPTSSLASPWSQTIIGSVSDSSSAALIDGVFSSVVIGGSGVASGSTSDNGRFIYQSRTGDGIITAYFPLGVPSDGGARVALMVRASTANNAIMAAAVGSSTTSYGTKLAYRTSAGASAAVLPSAYNGIMQPCWLRLTRSGSVFSAEVSSNGSTWTALGSSVVSGIPATALWGIFHCSTAWSVTSLGNYHTTIAQSVTIEDLAAPDTPTGLSATVLSPTSISLSWNSVAGASGYRIERRSDTNDYAVIADVVPSVGATQTYIDANVPSDTAFAYRVTAYNSTSASGASDPAYATTPLPYAIAEISTADALGADATVQLNMANTPLGLQPTVSVAGYYYSDGMTWTVLSNACKSYLRFNLAEAAPPCSVDLKLSFCNATYFEQFGYFDQSVVLLADASDAWDESSVTWANAPQNNVASYWFSGSVTYLGDIYEESLPLAGDVVRVSLNPATVYNNRGADNRVTIALAQYYGASIEWASREHATYAPPTLEIAWTNPLPSRPSFLTASAGWGLDVQLQWRDSVASEISFELERSVNGGAFAPLQSLVSNTVAFTDAATQPSTTYAYRIRAVNAAGPSSWAGPVSITTPDMFHAWGTLWDAGGTNTLASTSENWDLDVTPPFDGLRYFNFASSGHEASVNTAMAVSGLSLHADDDFALTPGGATLTVGAGGIRAANPGTDSNRTYTLGCPVALAAGQTWGITNNGAALTHLNVSGPVHSLASGFGITQTGDGILTLSGDNVYDGPTVVSSGCVMRVAHSHALGSLAFGTTVNNGGWLEVTGNVTVAESITLNGDAAVGSLGTLRSTGGTNTWSGAISQGVRARVAVAEGGSLALTGGVSGPGIYLSPASNACLSVSGSPIGVGTSSVYAYGAGTVAIGATGNAWGTLEVGNATLRMDADNVLPSTSILTMGVSGALDAILDLNGHDQTVARLMRGITASGNRLITSATPARLTVNQASTSTYYYDGALSGPVTLAKSGSGTLYLLGVGNTYSGDTVVSNGTLTVGAGVSLGSGTNILIAGGTLRTQSGEAISDNATLRINDGGKLYMPVGQTETVRELIIAGSRKWHGTWGSSSSAAQNIDNVHFQGTGMVYVPTGTSSSWDGGAATTAIDAPFNWDYDDLPPLDGTAVLSFGLGGERATLTTNASLLGIVLNRQGDFLIESGAGVLSLGQSGLMAAAPGDAACTYTLAAAVSLVTNQSWCVTNAGPADTAVIVTGGISDGANAWSLSKSGDGLLTLAGPNTYAGATLVETGSVLRVSHSAGLGSPAAATYVRNGAWLEVSGNVTVAEPLVLDGAASDGGGALRSVAGTNTWTGPVTQQQPSRIEAIGGSRLNLSGPISGTSLYLSPQAGSCVALAGQPLAFGSGTLYAQGDGVVAVSVTGNAWANMVVAGGTLRTEIPLALPSNSTVTMGSALGLDATFDLHGHSQSIALLTRGITASGNRWVTSASPATLTINQTTSSAYYDGDFGGSLSLVKNGTGTLWFMGHQSTSTGSVTINAGTFTLYTGAQFLNSRRITVAGGLLKLLHGDALSDEACLAISDGGAKVYVNAGYTETVQTLTLGGRLMRRGTYGATGSGADTIDNTHFSGTGKINVLRGTESFLFIR